MKKISILLCLVLFIGVLFVGCAAKEKDWKNAYAGLAGICSEEKYATFMDSTTNFAFQTTAINEAIENNQTYKTLRTVYERIVDESFESINSIYRIFENQPSRLEENGKLISKTLDALNESIKNFNHGAEQFLGFVKSYEFIVQSDFNANGSFELAQLLVFKKQYADFARNAVNLFDACQEYYIEAFQAQLSTSSENLTFDSIFSLQLNLKLNALNDALSFVVEEFDGLYNDEIAQTLLGDGLQQKLDFLTLDKETILTNISNVDSDAFDVALSSFEAIKTAQSNERELVKTALKDYDYSEDLINVQNEDDAVKKQRMEFVKNYITSSHKNECEAFGVIIDLLK